MKESGYMLSWRTIHLTGQGEGPFTEELQLAQGELLGSSSQVAGNKDCYRTEINPEPLSVRSSNPSRECPVRTLRPDCRLSHPNTGKEQTAPKPCNGMNCRPTLPWECVFNVAIKDIVPPLVLTKVPHTQATKPVSSALYSQPQSGSPFRGNSLEATDYGKWKSPWECCQGPHSLRPMRNRQSFPIPKGKAQRYG